MIKSIITILKKNRNYLIKVIKYRRYKFGKKPHFGRNTMLIAKTIRTGNNFYIGRYSSIECDAIIGNDVLISNFVALIGRYDHDYNKIGVPVRRSPHVWDQDYNFKKNHENIIFIEDDVWIGWNVIVLSGVKIKKGCIIAAGSILTKETEEYSIYAGNPAKKVGDRFQTEEDKIKHIAIIENEKG